MHKGKKQSNSIIENIPQKEKEKNENIDGKTKYDLTKINYNSDDFKKLIEERVDWYLMKEYDELFKLYEFKLNDLLGVQEKIFIKNEIIKQKIKYLENYLKNYCIKNNINYELLVNK